MSETTRGRAPSIRKAPCRIRIVQGVIATALLLGSQLASSQGAGPATSAACNAAADVRDGLRIPIMIGMAGMLFVSMLIAIKALRAQQWKLALALSEEAKLPDNTPPPAAGQDPPMVPSSSRLIALFGTIILGTFFVGIGFYVVWQLCSGCDINTANAAWAFFASGATLFLPYGVNKAASVLQ
jgi:hypothetical protein